MAELTRLTHLFEAIASRDWASAEAIAREIATAEERIGHHAAAQRLRGALHPNGRPSPSNSVHSTSGETAPRDSTFFLASALTPVVANRSLSELRLRASTRGALREIVSEWLHREKLAAHSLLRRTKLLFHGPPGCGKSITASAIGRELGLPVFVARFDSIVGAYLGQTALHLRQLFRFAETTPSVVLIDEIDALGKRRGNPLDVGELDRVVIALLQELEHSQPLGLLIATSNLARHLDDALWRRFDLVLDFPRPTRSDLQKFIVQRARSRHVHISPRIQALAAASKSYADAERFIDAEERRLILKTK